MPKEHEINCGYSWYSKKSCPTRGSAPHLCSKTFKISDEAYTRHYIAGNLGKALNVQCGKHKCKCGERCIGWSDKPYKLL